MQTKIKRIICLLLLACLASIKIYFIFLFKPILFGRPHDDSLYTLLASHIVDGEWLGSFGPLTLAKVPGYPLWLAMEHFLRLPPMMGEHIVYFIAIFFLYVALTKAGIKPVAAAIAMIVFIFSPELFNIDALRLSRNLLYDALTLLLVSICLLSLQARTWKKMVIFIAGYSMVMGFYYLVREEFIWILPIHAMFISCFFYTRERLNKYAYATGLALAIFPLLAVLAVDIGVKSINYNFYGVPVLYTQRDGNFPKAMGALQRIKTHTYRQYVTVPQEMRFLAYGVSPDFAELEFQLDDDNNSRARRFVSCKSGHICDDYAGSLVFWDIIEAAQKQNKYNTAENAETFFGAVAKQINTACDEGRISCLPPHDTLYPIFQKAMLPDIPVAARSIVRKLFHPSFLNTRFLFDHSVAYTNYKKLFPADGYIYNEDGFNYQEDHRLAYSKWIAKVWPVIAIFAFVGAPFYLAAQVCGARYKKSGVTMKDKLIISSVAIVLTGVICRLVLIMVLTVTSWDAPYGYIAPAYGLVSMLFVILFARLFDFCCGLSRPLANSGRQFYQSP